MRNNPLLLLMCLILLGISCSRKKDTRSGQEIRSTEEAMVAVNRMLVKKDQEKIQAYARQNDLAMKETPTGLWYLISRKGNGDSARIGQVASLRYSVKLLDGTPCYDSGHSGIKQFRIGQGGVESGLEEGILLLRVGDRATFIMPPHLAHGLTGDGDRIPARSIIIYEVELVKLEP
jgi:FKBP-type peptidyl-prolyl cis-trans isomerase